MMLQEYFSDSDEDNESICSDATVSSAEAERNLAIHNESYIEDESVATPNDLKQVVNLHVDAVNIYGENEGQC